MKKLSKYLKTFKTNKSINKYKIMKTNNNSIELKKINK